LFDLGWLQSKHFIDSNDIDAVSDVLRNKNITQGEMVNNLEKKICKYVKSRYAVAVTSCSAALHLSCKVLGIKKPCSKEDVIKAASGLQKKIHPDLNKNQNTEYLSKIVNNAKDTILKNDFS